MIKRYAMHHIAVLVLICFCAACQKTEADSASAEKMSAAERVKAGKALWEEKCRTVAGEKIYRKLDNVEGLLLTKVRPKAGESEWADRNWPGAAFARETTGDGYINSFLGYEYASNVAGRNDPVTPANRGYINTDRRPGGLSGYRYVDVIDEKDGKRYRYSGSNKVVGRMDVNATNVKINLQRNPNFDLNIYGWVLDKAPTTSPSPRYGVTFEDHVVPEERYLGVASSTVKVVDLKTTEVLGEMTRYAWSPGTSSPANPSPWLTAYRCGGMHSSFTDATTRQFVDQILIPAKGK